MDVGHTGPVFVPADEMTPPFPGVTYPDGVRAQFAPGVTACFDLPQGEFVIYLNGKEVSRCGLIMPADHPYWATAPFNPWTGGR